MRAAQMDRAVEFAATQFAGKDLPQLRLDGAQFLRQAKAGFQIPVIDAAQFAGQLAEGAGDFAPGEARHAADHGGRCIMVYKAGSLSQPDLSFLFPVIAFL